MESAVTIRMYSKIMTVVSIICFIIIGLFLSKVGDFGVLLTIVTWVAGVFTVLTQHAILSGFADIIDNTYKAAYGTQDKPDKQLQDSDFITEESRIKEYEDALMNDSVGAEKLKALKDMLATKYITEEQYNNSVKKFFSEIKN